MANIPRNILTIFEFRHRNDDERPRYVVIAKNVTEALQRLAALLCISDVDREMFHISAYQVYKPHESDDQAETIVGESALERPRTT